ncbi:MAG: ATP-dependent 6-phosphofructokinase [Saprospiraceae bacterium]|nr:MAG: ATP-dependent 6-phosphofructokinase [Saprospiraceae bacterium]
MKKILIATGGGDCPGLNAVIRAIAKAAKTDGNWEVWGSIEAFNGVLKTPREVIKLNRQRTAGIHVKGGTIIKTTNIGNPLAFPMQQENGTWTNVDRSDELIQNIRDLGFDAVVNVGGDGSQKISQALFEKGLNIIGVPKTIDNDLSCTDLTFGFSTAVQIATDSFDKLVTTAESHHRVMIMEVMGRDAGWIALHTAIAGGAELCLIPEIPFSIKTIMQEIKRRYHKKKGFANIVIAEGAKPMNGDVAGQAARESGDPHIKLGGIGNYLRCLLEENGCPAQIRTTILGHVQRGGTPIAFDRILATAMGEKAFQLIKSGEFGTMVTFTNNRIGSVKISEAVKEYNYLHQDHYLIKMARNIGISFGDENAGR